MAQYPRMDQYNRSRYDQGIDAKIVVMGNTGVGKTSLLCRYTQNKFDPKNTTATTGAFFVTKKVFVGGVKVRLQLWDTAGQERFRSMAPMYYRGANAALLLYDITNSSSFGDIRGWLEELKKNCSSDLIIYIVGSKADLHRHREVSSDLARLSLQNWFPPPRAPTPPPPPQPSTLSYIRPRFTSFTSIRSVPNTTQPPQTSPPLDSPPLKAPPLTESISNRSSGLSRRSTAPSRTSVRTNASSRSKMSTTGRSPPQGRFGPHQGPQTVGWDDVEETDDTRLLDEVEDESVEDESEWGLHKGMELFEVSAKDDIGIESLFDTLLSSIILRMDSIEQENSARKRDSVFLTSVNAPTWSTHTEEEKPPATTAGWACCSY